MMNNESNTVEPFSGWEDASDIQILEDTLSTKEVEKKDEIEIDAKEDKEEKNKKKQEKKDEKIAEEVFEDFKENTDGDDIEDDELIEEYSKEIKSDSKYVLDFLKQKGLVNFEESDEELTEEDYGQILEDSYEEAVDKKVSDMFSDIPDSVKNLVKYAINGGNVEELLSKMVQNTKSPIKKGMDLENEKNQELIVKTSRELDGEDSETTESYIEFLKESGKLGSIASKLYEKVIQKQQQEETKDLEKVNEEKKLLKERQRQYKNDLSSFFKENKEIKGVKIGLNESKELPSYIADSVVSLEDGRKVSMMQRDLFNALQDKSKIAIIAKLLRNDFDFSDIVNSEKTKYSKEIRQNLQRSKGISKTSSAKSYKNKTLADYF